MSNRRDRALESIENVLKKSSLSESESGKNIRKITKVEQQKHNKNRYSIFVDGQYSFSAGEDTLVEHMLLKGKELDSDFIEDVIIADEKNKAKSAAFRYIGYKMRSEREVRDKLSELGYSDFADEIADYMTENGYINDREYALSYTREKINLKSFGEKRIEAELKMRGIAPEYISNALREAGYGETELQKAEELAEKRMRRSYKDENDRYRKIYGFLLRRGYSTETAKKALEKVLNG